MSFISTFSAFNNARNNDTEKKEKEHRADDNDDHPSWTDSGNGLFEVIAVARTFFEIGNVLILELIFNKILVKIEIYLLIEIY